MQMADHPGSHETNQFSGAGDTANSASLIHVPASAQLDPDAIERCPVCGILYTVSGQPMSTPQPSPDQPPATGAAEGAAPAVRVVIRCTYCGTYSIGAQRS